MSFLVNPFRVTPAGDPFFSSVVQLAHFDGGSGSTTYTNSCSRGNTMTAVLTGLNTSVFKFGTASLRTTSSSQGATAASHADYNFSTGDWTIEFWIRLDSLTLDFNSLKVFYDSRPGALTAGMYPIIYSDTASGNIKLNTNNIDRCVGANGSLSATTWTHIAACRASGTLRLFVNGTQVGSSFTDGNTYVQSGFNLMMAGNAAGTAVGYMDDLRITKGVGRYAANFTPPTAAFPNS